MTKNLYLLFLSTVLLLGFQSSIEERLYTLNRDLMCPVCDGLTLEQSQAAPALEMKDEIKKMVIQGMSDEEIKEHFVQKYGIEILADPPKKGFDTLVWLAPLFFGFFGIKTQNPAGVIQASDQLTKDCPSDTVVRIMAENLNGDDDTTHTYVVFYENNAAYVKWSNQVQTCPGWGKYFQSMSSISEQTNK